MKGSEAAEIVLMLIKAYPYARCDEQHADIYERSLADLDARACRAAVQRLIHTNKFLPTIAEIRSAVADQTLGPRRTGVEAYDLVMQAVRKHGRCYGGEPAPKFRDQLIAKAIGVWGSWNDLCSSPSDDAGGRARFIELYDELAGRERQAVASGQRLPEPANDSPAFWVEPPRARAKQLAAAQPAVNLAAALATRTPPRPKHPDPEPRRWSAAELDAALDGAR